MTPLHFACKGGAVAVAQLLLSRGANMEARDGVRTVDQIFHHHNLV